MFELSTVDLDEMATALQDQTAYEHRWLIDPESGQLVIWTEDGGVDGRTPVDLDEVDLAPTDPPPSYMWYPGPGVRHVEPSLLPRFVVSPGLTPDKRTTDLSRARRDRVTAGRCPSQGCRTSAQPS